MLVQLNITLHSMAFLAYSIILLSFLVFISFLLVLYTRQMKKSIIPTKWPFLGMIPAALVNVHRLHEYATEVLACSGGTFLFKSFTFSNTDMLLTANPLDIHHILSKNFPNYPKGQKFRKLFDIFGDGIFSTDGDLWEFHRKTITSLFEHKCFPSLLENTFWNKVEVGLLPVLEDVSRQGVELDLQDIFQRFTFDTICKLLFEYDPKSMSLDFPDLPCEKALCKMEEAILFRHFTPSSFWKLQQLLGVGNEKKLSDAWETLDQFIYKCLDPNQNKYSNRNIEDPEEKFCLLTSLMREFKDYSGTSGNPKKFMRDTFLNLMAAGRDSTSSALSWFFYLLAKHPIVEGNIIQEIQTQLEMKIGEKWKRFHEKELGKLVYLQGALFEALRLFPPISLNHKVPLQPDILPSGHQVDHNTSCILSYYSMGRMKSVWGEDCMEYKPERWITKHGKIKHQPFYKFPAFNAGPRTCVGKHMTLCQIKIVATTIIYHYHVELVEGHPVVPSDSIILQIKDGLKVRLTKRAEIKF